MSSESQPQGPGLTLLEGRVEPERLELAGPILLGRSEECDAVVFDEAASRRHARLEPVDGHVELTDLKSANGTWVNGARVERVALRHGDEIAIGSTRLRFLGGRDDSTVVLPDTVEVESSILVREFDPAASNESSRLNERLRLLHDVANLLGRERASDLLEALLGRLGESLPIRRAAALRHVTGALTGGTYWRRDGARSKKFEVSQTIARRVIETGEGLLIRSVGENAVLGRHESLIRDRTESALVAPLIIEGTVIGVLYADAEKEAAFTRDDLELVLAIAAPAALAIRNAELVERLTGENARLRHELGEGRQLLGSSQPFQELLDLARRMAGQDSTILVTGETGTGKELIARFIHEQSARAHGPFVAVNCAALPPALVESELFGHVAGAFTGALADHPGQFRLANGGTLFLDELGELPLEVQAKLLRVLEEREVRPLGGESTLPIDIRVVTATHRDLKEEIAAGRFREDLYYRLGVLRLAVPALRDRASDVRLLAESFLATIAPDGGRRFSDEAIARLEAYAWPGNVRELRNVVERLAILSTGEVIDASDLPPDLGAPSPKAMDGGDVITLKEAERRAIVAAWKATGGKKGETAERLGISWPTLNKKMKEYGIA